MFHLEPITEYGNDQIKNDQIGDDSNEIKNSTVFDTNIDAKTNHHYRTKDIQICNNTRDLDDLDRLCAEDVESKRDTSGVVEVSRDEFFEVISIIIHLKFENRKIDR